MLTRIMSEEEKAAFLAYDPDKERKSLEEKILFCIEWIRGEWETKFFASILNRLDNRPKYLTPKQQKVLDRIHKRAKLAEKEHLAIIADENRRA